MTERQISSSDLTEGHVIKLTFDSTQDPKIKDTLIYWIRGDNGDTDIQKRVLSVEDQLRRTGEIPVIDVLDRKWGFYIVEGVYEPEEIGANDPRGIIPTNGKDSGLEPIDDPSKLGLNTLVHTTTKRLDVWPSEFDLRLREEYDVDGQRLFHAEVVDESGGSYSIPETDFLRGKHEWMRFVGIVPQKPVEDGT